MKIYAQSIARSPFAVEIVVRGLESFQALKKCRSFYWRRQRTAAEVTERMESLHPAIAHSFIIKWLIFNGNDPEPVNNP
jgi:hypothetical protein